LTVGDIVALFIGSLPTAMNKYDSAPLY